MANFLQPAIESLSKLDSSVFHWINRDISNPVLDVVMPFLSGNRFFMPLAVLTVVLLIWRGRLRGFLCIAVCLLAIWFGDGLVNPTLKNAVGRSRPPLVFDDVQVRVGTGSSRSGSFPSSHAANWMCLTVVAFAYYRRSLRITLPLALLVGASRIYNGVHFPSDVLGGMIIGAACGWAVLLTANSLWTGIGRNWFPLWWQKFPSLLPSAKESEPEAEEPEFRPRGEKGPASARHETVDSHWLRLGYILLAATLLGRLAFLAFGPLQLSPDEAYQWHWSKHLDLSYFSKPPMIAYAQFIGTTLWGDTEFGVRFLSPVIAAILGVLLLRFFAREVNARAGFFLLLALNTTLMLSAGAVLMTFDPLSVLFWTAAMISGWSAVQDKSTTADWAWTGLWMGMGFLSKYTALFQLLCWAVFFVLWPPARKQLRRMGPWVALLIMAVCSLPVLIWNARHNWVTVAHVADDAGAGEKWTPTLRYVLDFLGAELGLLNPVFFVLVCWACVAFWKQGRRNPKLVFFFSMGVPLFLVYFLFSFKSRVLPNWIAPAVIPMFIVAAMYWDTRIRLGQTRVKAWLYAGLVSGAALVLLAHDTSLTEKLFHVELPPKLDPLRRVKGWPEAAKVVYDVQQEFQQEGPPVFIIGSNYGITAELSFYMPDTRWLAGRRPFVYCASSPRPRNQFDFWPGYEGRVGQNALFVRELKPDYKEVPPAPARLVREFGSVTEKGIIPVKVKHDKAPSRCLQIFLCRDLLEPSQPIKPPATAP